jgi:hypothetical protein
MLRSFCSFHEVFVNLATFGPESGWEVFLVDTGWAKVFWNANAEETG